MARIPTSGEHKGVPLFVGQSAASMERARRHIDAVSVMVSIDDLVAVCVSKRRASEARLWAFSRLKAWWQQTQDERRVRPDIDIADIESHVAHLGGSWHPLIEGWPPPDDEEHDG